MLKLNTDEIKNLQFEVSIQGINYDELQGSLKFMIEDIEYGIPVKINQDMVSVEVPPLQEIVAKGMRQGDVVECKLDIFGNGFYINPWGGQFELQTTAKVEAKGLEVSTKKPERKVVAELKSVKSKTELDNETILEMLFAKLEERGMKLPDISTMKEPVVESAEIPVRIVEQAEPTLKKKVVLKQPEKLNRKQLVEQKIKAKFDQVGSIISNVKSLTEGKKVIRNTTVTPSCPIKKVATVQTEDLSIMDKLAQLKASQESGQPASQNVEQTIVVDTEDPIYLMESVGMKNPKIQEAMLEKAKELGGDGSKSLAETLKKLLGINEQANNYDQYMNIVANHDR